MSWALSRPARSAAGMYYEVAASPRGDVLLWYPGAGPMNLNNMTPGVLGIVSLIVNKIAFKGRWRVVVRQAAETREINPTTGVLWRKDVRKRDVEPLMQEPVTRIEAGRFHPEQKMDGVVEVPLGAGSGPILRRMFGQSPFVKFTIDIEPPARVRCKAAAVATSADPQTATDEKQSASNTGGKARNKNSAVPHGTGGSPMQVLHQLTINEPPHRAGQPNTASKDLHGLVPTLWKANTSCRDVRFAALKVPFTRTRQVRDRRCRSGATGHP